MCNAHFGPPGLDDFPARYYSSTQGRWYSPDWASAQVPVPYADLHNPQTLNLYDYVGGDPTNHADPDGHLQTTAGGDRDEDLQEQQRDETAGHTGNLGLARDWLDVVEVSGSYGWSAGVSGQAGSEVKYEGTTGVTTEGTIGLGLGNGDVKVSADLVSGKAKLGDLEGSVKAGIEVSPKEGVKAQASAEVSAGSAKAGVSVDRTGVHTSVGAQKTGDTKLGGHVHGGLGVGVNINLSQAGRAWDRSVRSVNALGQYLVNKFMPTGSIF